MAKSSDRNHVSTAFWMFAIFILWIPVVNVIMVVLWAFTGQNESRQNYFKALIAWFVIGVLFWIAVLVLGSAPFLRVALHSLRTNLGL